MTYNKTACIIITLALTIFMASSVMACRRKEQESPASSLPPLTVAFFHTQDDADCILLTQEGCTVMIDTGEKKDAEHILEELAAREITHLDYLILTHADKDHIGGVKKLLKEITVGQVIEPRYISEDWEKVNEEFSKQEIPVLKPAREKSFSVGEGGLEFTIYPPMESSYEKENNYSLCTLVTHGTVHMLFTGDALAERSRELMEIDWPEIALFKVPHHGRVNDASETFMQTISAESAVVTAVECSNEIRACAEEAGTQLFCTADGDVMFESDGKVLRVLDITKME